MMAFSRWIGVRAWVLALTQIFLLTCVVSAQTPAAPRSPSLEMSVIKPGVRTAAVNGLWNRDKHYRSTPQLTAHTSVTIADLKGPGTITAIHLTGMQELVDAGVLRGIVIEIYFDGEKGPAVLCPLSDFFGDGLNGRSNEFTSTFVEKVPFAYNAYFPMPFKQSARVILRNDTDLTPTAYSFVEWEQLPAWDPALGYFHATFLRRSFRLTENSREEFLRIKGRGQLIGRQWSIATDEPNFKKFHFVMEGNNEISIDGDPLRFDYLGSEDSFSFSWGFIKPFTGPRAGMTYLATKDNNTRLSIYRFHEHMPIRFDRELAYAINWQKETADFGKQSGWVDYAAVFYWYQDAPAGFTHEPLAPLAMRCRDIQPEPSGK